jgi:riboflavin kinase/FMN adenylyltransferase
VIAPGNHDGVHLGHRALIRTARRYAEAHRLQTCALTFDPHPLALLDPERAPTMLTTQPRRAELLRSVGADEVIVLPFTRELAASAPEEFVDALVGFGARGLVVGPDFRFGKQRAGDVAQLQRWGKERGFEVLIEEPVRVDGERVSSTAIRSLLRAGELDRANDMLARVHEITGRVVKGDQRGRTIGFPTANLAIEPVLAPADGVYAIVARVLGGSEPSTLIHGVANLGTRPTFAAGRSVEAHLFDFERDIYGAELRVGFVARVRGEQKFAGVNELKAQITRDCATARERIAACPKEIIAWI